MIEELKRFLLVVQEGNITRSAEKLFITQSALTQSIHRLEKHFNTKLFQQQGKHLTLTEDGKAVVIISEKILHLWSRAQDPQKRLTQVPTYTIGMFDNSALRLGEFFRQHMQSDKYKLELRIDTSGKLRTQLSLGALDAALCVTRPNDPLPNHITLVQSFTEKLIPVTAKLYKGQIQKMPFILYNSGSNTRKQIDMVFLKHKFQPTIFAESTSVTFMRELALLGCGIALLPENFIKHDIDQGRLKMQKMPMQWQREYGLFLPKDSPRALPSEFLQELQRALRD